MGSSGLVSLSVFKVKVYASCFAFTTRHGPKRVALNDLRFSCPPGLLVAIGDNKVQTEV